MRPLPAIAACALLGCRPDPARPAGDGSAGPVEVECPEGAVVLDDSSNYSLISQVDIPSTAVAPGADVAVDFSAVGTDLFGQPLDPAADLDTVAIVQFPGLDEAETAAALANNLLLQSDVGTYMAVATEGATAVRLSDLSIFGNSFDPGASLLADSGTWLLTLNTGEVAGKGARQVAFLAPTAGETNQALAFDLTGASLALTVDLEGGAATALPASGAALDLSALTRNGLGYDFDSHAVDAVWLAWFDDDTLAALEADFLNLEQRADRLYTQAHTGATTLILDALVDAEGAPPPAMTADGTWLLALRCSDCINSAPQFLTRVTPCVPADTAR